MATESLAAGRRTLLSRLALAALTAGVSACSAVRFGGEKLISVGPEDVKAGDPQAAAFGVPGHHGYERIWQAALQAMSQGMTVVESHRPSGVIKSRSGDKMVGFFITPTAPSAPSYRVETFSIRPVGLNSLNRRGWDPKVIEDFNAALGAR